MTRLQLIPFVLAFALFGCGGGNDPTPGSEGFTPSEAGFGLQTLKRSDSTDGTAGSVSEKFIFSTVKDEAVEGEGFLVDLGNGKKFVAADRFQDNPHDIENARRRFMAVLRGVNEFDYYATEPLQVFMEYKSVLGFENVLLSEAEYKALAARVRELGKRKRSPSSITKMSVHFRHGALSLQIDLGL
ncbi:MAG: hypothetical protein V1798_01535 [Pseudomonadota bacterium]